MVVGARRTFKSAAALENFDEAKRLNDEVFQHLAVKGPTLVGLAELGV